MAKRRASEPLKEEEKRPLNVSSFKKLLEFSKYFMPYKGKIILGLLSLGFSTFTILAFPKLAGELLDAANGKSKYFTSITEVTIAMVVVLFVQSIFSFARVYTFSVVSASGIANVRRSLFQKVIWLPMTFFDRRRVGELMSRLTSDVATLQDTFSTTLAEFLRQVLTLTFGTTIIFVLTPRLSIFMLLTFPVLIVSALLFGRLVRRLSRDTQDKLAEANVIVEESLQSVFVVKSFTSENFEVNRYSRKLTEVIGFAFRSARYNSLFISFVIFVIFGSIVAIGSYGANLVQAHLITTGELFSFVFYSLIIGASIGGLGDIYTGIQRAIGSTERVLEMLREKDEREEDVSIPRLKGKVSFRDVSFAYPTRTQTEVLRNLNFSIEPGEKIALVGPSGSGKSTIISLLMRLYPTKAGGILVDDKIIDQYNLTAYRANIGVVPQEVILFGGTIYENIAYGKPSASEEEVREAARKANALEFIDGFPDKFQTIVGERGVKLSGGQRQRVAIARAILKDPAILILDEATSSLDAQSEHLVQAALEQLMEGRTTIVIAHRLSTIRKVDRIFVIKDGKLAETGSHSELTSVDNGIYSNLLKLQLQ